MTTKDGSTHNITVGTLAHRIVSSTLRAGWPEARHERNQLILRTGRSEMAAHPVTYRPREALLDAVTAAGVYLWRFLPESDWAPIMIDEALNGGGRPDVVFDHAEHGVLIDELKLGVGRFGESMVRAQIDRYLDEGTALFGERLIGVRLCSVHEPARSRIYLPGRTRSMLASDHPLCRELAPR